MLRSLLKTRLLDHLRHVIPFRSKKSFEPDVEYSMYAKTKKARLGLAKIKIHKELFPASEKISVRDLLPSKLRISPRTKPPKIRHIRPIHAEGSYYGLKSATTYGSRGYYVSYTLTKRARSRIALIPTIISAVIRNPSKRKIGIDDIRMELRKGRRRLLLMIVLDASESMQPFIPIIIRTLLKFHGKAWKLRSLIGLIAVQENTAKILTYPTTNINKIISGFLKVEFLGKTPLALGLLKAYRLILSMRTKYPDIIPRVLILSDGIANIPLNIPVNKNIRDYFESDAQADVIAIARLLAKRGIKLIVVNPWHIEYWPAKYILSPTELLKLITKISGGIYLGFNFEQQPSGSILLPRIVYIDDITAEELAEKILEAIFESIP